ncbi:hypothetical protein K490DRAFT_68005 [Saccharata proteae CBS 121410]|uniref:Uncharacterized protein n=1 Tax=Saccharata proteae CBS 121410 TaxID=1314787 RepID=A0A9P4HNT8_9PEZI|nr:hypothetical protein K490DRAFT_68005 [Saccharata proteae CBS 121410]
MRTAAILAALAAAASAAPLDLNANANAGLPADVKVDGVHVRQLDDIVPESIIEPLIGGLRARQVGGLTKILPTNGLPTNGLPTNGLPTNDLPINDLPINSLPISSLGGLTKREVDDIIEPLIEPLIGGLRARQIGGLTKILPTNGLPTNDLPINDLPISSLPISSLGGLTKREVDDLIKSIDDLSSVDLPVGQLHSRRHLGVEPGTAVSPFSTPVGDALDDTVPLADKIPVAKDLNKRSVISTSGSTPDVGAPLASNLDTVHSVLPRAVLKTTVVGSVQENVKVAPATANVHAGTKRAEVETSNVAGAVQDDINTVVPAKAKVSVHQRANVDSTKVEKNTERIANGAVKADASTSVLNKRINVSGSTVSGPASGAVGSVSNTAHVATNAVEVLPVDLSVTKRQTGAVNGLLPATEPVTGGANSAVPATDGVVGGVTDGSTVNVVTSLLGNVGGVASGATGAI